MAYPASPQAAETPLKAHPEEPDVGSGDYDIALSPIDGDSTGQAQLESPTSKWLREESEQRHAASAKSNSLQTDRERHSARLITRPKSNGNDTQTYPFVNAPSQPKRCTAWGSKDSRLEGSSSSEQGNNAKTAHRPKEDDAQQDRTQAQALPSHNTTTAAPADRPKPSHSPSPERLPSQTTTIAQEAVVVSSDQILQNSTEPDGTDSTADMRELEGTPNDSGIALETDMGCENPRQPIADSSPSVNSPFAEKESVDRVESRIDEQQASHRLSHPSTPAQPHARKTTGSATPVMSLTGERSVRVEKRNHRTLPKQRADRLPYVPADEQTPSDDDILMVLIHRRKQMEDNLVTAHAKVRTLQTRNNTLQKQNQDYLAQVEHLSKEKAEVNGKHEELLLDLEAFKTKYYKLKDFAKNLGAGMSHLRAGSEQQSNLLQELRNEGEINQAAIVDVKTAVGNVELSLKDQAKALAATHREMNKSFQTIDKLRNELSNNVSQLSEEKRQSRRLEAHHTRVAGSQERLYNAIQRDNKSIIQWMQKVHLRLERVDAAVADVEVKNVASECLDVVRELQQFLHDESRPIAGERQAWMDSLTALQQVVKDNHTTIAKSVETMGNSIHVSSVDVVKSSIAEILCSVQGLRPDMDTTMRTDLMNNQLSGKVEGKDEMISVLKDQLAEQNKSIGQAVSTCSELAKQSKKRKIDDEQMQQVLIKYQSASSNFAKAKEDLDKANQEKVVLTQKIHDLQSELQQERTERQRHEDEMQKQQEDTAASHQNVLSSSIDKREKEIHQLKNVLKEAEDKIGNANTEVHRLQQVLAGLQSKHDDLKTELLQLRESKTELTCKLNESLAANKVLQDDLADLKDIRTQLETSKSEVRRLQQFESQFVQANLELEGLKQTVADKDGKIAGQIALVQELEAKAAQVSGLQRVVEELEQAKTTLSTKLEHAEAQAKTVPDLLKQLQSRETRAATFESELERLRPFEQQLTTSRAEKDHIAQAFLQTKDDLTRAQQQLDANADLEAKLRTKEEEITRLQQQMAEAAQAQTNLATLEQESQLKDSKIANLTSEVNRLKEESQAFEQVSSEIPEDLLEPIRQHFTQPSLSIPDSVAEQLINSQDLPSSLVRNGNAMLEDPPQRRVADRSGKARSQRPKLVEPGVEIEETQKRSQETDLIPDSQMLNTQRLSHVNGFLEEDRSDSPLTELSDSEQGTADWLEREINAQNIVAASATQTGIPHLPRSEPYHPEPNAVRPSSSATSMDLFRKHEDSLGGTQNGSMSTHEHLSSTPQRQTVNPTEVLLRPPESTQSQTYLSPNRLRDGRIHGNEAAQLSQRESTPDQERPRPQPNSAVKRSNEDDSQSSRSAATKRRKRDMDSVREALTATPSSTQTRNGSKDRSAARSSRGLIDSDAPTPGRSQRSARKTSRKASKIDKYSDRFGVSA